ncbi:hypothetical protein BDW59DRAFT_146740 [Aspergillus cavernicola]|uniref:Uncharacterized protein n=1 Tax=Aspergillus cavernicola TaxID=176166 RepID=A0ABR4IBB0_9EURO
MDKISNIVNSQKGGGQAGGGGGGASGGQSDFLNKGLNDAEKKVGGQYYDEKKMEGTNKKVTDKVKDKFQNVTGHKLPGTH